MQNRGFTLIELSIVLVIIGLIVGGVLVGQDLIKAAQIRATVSQYEKYSTAVNTFRTKYNGVPGDLLATEAAAFSLCPTAGCPGAAATGLGDGNGLINDTQSTNLNRAVGETLAFWEQLSAANLIDGSLGTGLTSGYSIGASTVLDPWVPAAKIGNGNYWHVGSNGGFNYFVLAGDTLFVGTTPPSFGYGVALTPVEAYNIDIKVDDGAPNTGIIQARAANADHMYEEVNNNNAAVWNATPSSQSPACMTTGVSATDTANTYSRAAGATVPRCILRMRFN